MWRRLGLALGVVAGLAVVALVGAWALWGDPSRWGCPSGAELSQSVSDEAVVEAFKDRGVALVPARRHGAITTYRSRGGGATLFVNVCSTNCSPNDG